MKRISAGVVLLATCAAASAQVATLTREQLVQYTQNWKGDRFPDGRPKVEQKLMDKMDRTSKKRQREESCEEEKV